MIDPTPLFTKMILLRPDRVQDNLDQIRAAGLVEQTPNLWQISLGVLRMAHRLVFRPETIGTCGDAQVRPTARARFLARRPLRFPFLIYERAIAPLDLSGLISTPERVTKHLLGAFHDGDQFAYDFDLLRAHPGALETVAEQTRAIVDGTHPRAAWLRDLTVFDGYHENLLAAVDRFLADDFSLTPQDAADPDISFLAYLDWCAAQPRSFPETMTAWRDGHFTLAASKATS